MLDLADIAHRDTGAFCQFRLSKPALQSGSADVEAEADLQRDTQDLAAFFGGTGRPKDFES